MFNRRRLRGEQLEYYLAYLILRYRTMILFGGLLVLAYAMVVIFSNPLAGCILLLPAIYLFLLGNSYNVALYTARLGAWIGMLGRHED